jgi:hypothetical protein
VPADRVDQWPRDGQKYIPVEAKDFENWTQAANDATTPNPSNANIDLAEYVAKLGDDGLVRGTAKWTITLRGKQPALLPLQKLSQNLSDARWEDLSQGAARIGQWGATDRTAPGPALEVRSSGRFEFNWSVQSADKGNKILIPWQFPPSTSTRFSIELPEGLIPAIDGAVVLNSGALAPEDAASKKPWRRWSLAFASATDADLQFSRKKVEAATATSQLSLTDNTRFEISQGGLIVNSLWQLEGMRRERRELAIPLPRGAQVTSVSSSGKELDWHVERASAASEDQAIAILPDVANSDTIELKITSWFPLLVNKTWKLPLLRPDGVAWIGGGYQLSVVAPLELQGLNPIDCLQDSASHIGEPRANAELYGFTAYSPTAIPEVTIGRRQPQPSVRIGASLVLSHPDVTGRIVTEFSVANSSLHHLSGDLASSWTVETVETIPSDAMADWFIDRRGNRRQLEIQLTKAVSANQKVSVVVMGRLQQFSMSTPIPADKLRFINWSGAHVNRHLLSFQTTNPFSVEPVGNLTFVDRESLTDDDRRLFDDVTDLSRVADLSADDSGAGLQLSFKRPAFNADVDSQLEVTGTGLRQLTQILVEPEDNTIDRLLVFASAPLEDNVKWVDMSTNYPIQAERLPASDPQQKKLPSDGELWSLRLSRPASKNAVIVVSSTSKSFKRKSLPLLSLPEASQQRGRVLIHSTPEVSCFADPSGLVAIPLPLGTSAVRAESTPSAQAAFRYNPADCFTSTDAPKLVLTTSGRSHASLLFREANLESFYWPDGRATHVCAFRLENLGVGEFNLPLPVNAHLKSAVVNGQSVGLASSESSRSLPAIHLPAQSRFATVVIYFDTREPEFSIGSVINPPLNAKNSPIISGNWTVWLPNDFHVATESDPAIKSFDWGRRLFGPLARNSEAAPFNPLRAGDWARAVNRFTDWRTNVATPMPLNFSGAQASDAAYRGKLPLLANVNEPDDTAAQFPGWHAYREHFVAELAPIPLTIEHRSAMTAWSVVTLFCTFLLGARLCRRSWRTFIVLTAAAAALAILLPLPIASLATGALWGLLLSSLAEWPRKLLATGSRSESIRRSVAIASLAVALAISWNSSIFADPGEMPNAAQVSQPRVERVLIPIDANRKTVGSKYYLSETFLRSLLPETTAAGSHNNQWLLRGATYSADLTENRSTADISPGNWTTAFDVETFSRNTTISLPIVRDEAIWQPTAMLDGVPTPLEWQSDGRSCRIHIDQPGRYSLTLYCAPRLTVASDHIRLSLTIPPSLSSVLRLRQPAASSGLQINGTPTSNDSQITFPIGAIDHLALKWPRPAAKSELKQAATITALSWLHLDTASTRLDTKFIIESGSHQPETLTIAYDERWTPDSSPDLAIEAGDIDKSSGKRTLKVVVPAAGTDRQEIELHWRIAAPPSLGNFRVPTVELTSSPTAQRWFAFSSDPSFDCTMSDGTTAATTPKEFATRWGASPDGTGPLQVIDDTSANRVWTISVRPRLSEPVVGSDLHVAVGEHGLRLSFQAAITPGRPRDSQCKLIVPANMTIGEVRLSEGDRQIPTRQVRVAENQLQIFFGHPIESDYHLTITGYLPLKGFGPFAVPQMTFSRSSTSAQQLHLYRDDNLQVELQHFPNADDSSAEPTDLAPIEWLVRPLGVYRLGEAAAAAPTFTIIKTEPKLVGDSLTTLARDSKSWIATYHAQLIVQSGALDILHLRAPTQWTEPFQIESNVPASVDTTLRDDGSRDVVVRFTNTVAKGGKATIRIRAPLPTPSSGEVELPEIAPETHVDGHRYAVVPASLDSQPINWVETGVRPADVPPVLESRSIDRANQRQLEIVDEQFRIAQKSKPASLLLPRVRLADTFIAAGGRGSKLVVTRFVLISNGPASCTLALPPGQELRAITLNGRPALTAAVDGTHWRIALGSADLPQLIQVVSQSIDDPIETYNELRRPVLLLSNGSAVPVDVSLWTVSLPRQWAQSATLLPAVTAVDHAALRLDRLVSIAESATSTARESTNADVANWFRTWSAMLKGVRDRATGIGESSGTTPQVARTPQESIARPSDRLDAWLKQQARRLGSAIPTDAAPQSAAIEPSFDLPAAFDQPGTLHFVSEGGTDRLALNLESPVTRGAAQGLGILVVAVFASATIWLARSPLGQDFICRWPHIVGILVGLLWWAWLAPSWLGLVIIAATLWHSLRFDWPGRSIRAEASTVLRSTRSH